MKHLAARTTNELSGKSVGDLIILFVDLRDAHIQERSSRLNVAEKKGTSSLSLQGRVPSTSAKEHARKDARGFFVLMQRSPFSA